MIIQAFEISLICVAIHAIFWKAMILHPLKRIVGSLIWMPLYAFMWIACLGLHHIPGLKNEIAESSHTIERYCLKPLFNCLICMSSVWTVIVGHFLFHMHFFDMYFPMLLVCGMNVCFDSIIYYLRGEQDEL